MARVTAPLMSMDASGQLGKSLVFSKWKGRAYVREYVIPENPNSTKQANVRTAFNLLVESWQGETALQKAKWDVAGAAFAESGFNRYVGQGMKAYVAQLTTSVAPVSVTVAGDPPVEVWTWSST